MKKKSKKKSTKRKSKKTTKKVKKVVKKKAKVKKKTTKKPSPKLIKTKSKPVKIKPASGRRLREKVPTGVGNFDRLVEGGFEKDSINLLVGTSGSGKSTFSVQFLIEGIKKGERCLYITFEEKKEEFFANMFEVGWDLTKLEKEGKLIFLEYTPEKVKTMLEEGGGLVESIVLRKKIKRIVIDSITSFELLFNDELKKREAALSLFNLLRKWSITTLLTYEADPFSTKGPTPTTSAFESDSITSLYFLRMDKKRERFIEVLKMRGSNHSREVYPFDITKTGIMIGKKPLGYWNVRA